MRNEIIKLYLNKDIVDTTLNIVNENIKVDYEVLVELSELLVNEFYNIYGGEMTSEIEHLFDRQPSYKNIVNLLSRDEIETIVKKYLKGSV